MAVVTAGADGGTVGTSSSSSNPKNNTTKIKVIHCEAHPDFPHCFPTPLLFYVDVVVVTHNHRDQWKFFLRPPQTVLVAEKVTDSGRTYMDTTIAHTSVILTFDIFIK